MSLPTFTEDKIVYEVVTNGGIDGKSNDKGMVKFAAFNRPAAEKAATTYDNIKMTAFSASELQIQQKAALAKLTGLEKLLLGVYPEPKLLLGVYPEPVIKKNIR